MSKRSRPPADPDAWEKDKPRSTRTDKHGRPELLVHPHLLRAPAPLPRMLKDQK